ncbi:MAG: class I SAM-dependent methyltransferase [Fibrobacterota bacterium]|nr:class I SAM-dependent methyltransferase [Fibrobacterota bacterium]
MEKKPDMNAAGAPTVESISILDSEGKKDIVGYRNSEREKERVGSLFQLVPMNGNRVLDIGARDGFLSLLLAERYASVTALDLDPPRIDHPRVTCVHGDMTAMEFNDGAFDMVLCAEVLEHIPPALLPKACAEISRVARDRVVIGVPFRQDIRLGRSDCLACGGKNPPYGHVNAFDEKKLASLFPGLSVERFHYVGKTRERTNAVSTLLMDFAGNPYGTYGQEEGCVHCGAKLKEPQHRNFAQKVATFTAHRLRLLLNRFSTPRANWIHVSLRKPAA